MRICALCGTKVERVGRDHIAIALESMPLPDNPPCVCIECAKSIRAAAELLRWEV